jgi:hypothetical protein
MVQHDAGLPVTGVVDDATLQVRNQTNPCLSTTAEGRLGIQLLGSVTCDEAIAAWAQFAAEPAQDPSAPDANGWTCTAGSDSPAFEPAVAGSCARPNGTFQVLAGWS